MKRSYLGYWFISPWLVGFLALTVLPFFISIYLSFCRYDVVSPPVFIGVQNYAELFSNDPLFSWLSDPRWAMRTLVLMSLWGVGGSVIPYLAGLKDIPISLYEAARSNGAGAFARALSLLPILALPRYGVRQLFLMRQVFLTLPLELSEAARIEGATEWQILSRIVLPLSKPVLATCALFQFLGTWNDFFGPLLYINNPEKYTLAYGLQQFMSSYGGKWGQLMAASTLFILPIIVLFFAAQKTFIQGIATTGSKA